MSFVHLLDNDTINKIAAGEVVERPASVIKELVENSIDARADRIEVEILAGGTSFIRVTDNGIGMSREDARLAVKRHATSKILQVEDLQGIATLGFRGEALPSIASVSRFSLSTRQAGSELGTEISISGGGEADIRETGCNLGTTIRVEDLFFNTPARKKFLKTTATENSRVNEIIIKLALARPDIAFKLIANNRKVLATPGNGNLREAIEAIYGREVGGQLLELKLEDNNLRLWGFTSKPSTIRSNRGWQTFIVNGRIVANRAIAKAVDNGYHALLPRTGYPLAVINIEVPANSIDVNVHPQKTEMKFEDEGKIFKGVYKAILDCVHQKEKSMELVSSRVENPQRYIGASSVQMVREKNNHFTSGDLYQEIASIAKGTPKIDEFNQPAKRDERVVEYLPRRSFITEEKPVVNREEMPQETSPSKKIFSPIGQVDNTYIIAKDHKGLYIIDQHAAHERILYDRFAGEIGKIPTQGLLIHILFKVREWEEELIFQYKELFADLGFHLEPSSEQEFRLMEIPADVPAGEAEMLIREILAELAENHQPTAAELRHTCLAMTACKAAIKAGTELNMRQMELLLEELEQTEMPYTCPHGRPTVLRFGSDELAKMFKRTGF